MQDDDDLIFGGASDDKDEIDKLIDFFARGEEYDRRVKECADKIMTCYEDVSRELLDPSAAYGLFLAFSKLASIRPPKRKKGPHNLAFDKALLAAYDEALPGQRKSAVRDVGIKFGKTEEAAVRHLRRLLQKRRQTAAVDTSLTQWRDLSAWRTN